MFIKIYTVGPIAEHPYLLIDQKSKEALVVDPGGGSDQIVDDLSKHNSDLKFIINTHGHPDHIAENAILSDMTSAPILIHKNDSFALNFDFSNFSQKYNLPVLAGKANQKLVGGEKLDIGDSSVAILHTPGHTPGSICLYLEENNIIFTGDTLFYHTIGKTNLPFSNPKQMKKSLEKIFSMPDNTTILPGHGPSSTISEEKKFSQSYYDQLLR